MAARNSVTEWAGASAPSLEDFERVGKEALAKLPTGFLARAGDIVIRVADFPDDDILDEMDAETPFDLLGLFRGVGLAHDEATPQSGQLPNMIWLYRRPILDYWAEHEESLGAVISHVLIHEIGHHFGLSDDDMETIEDAAG
jgi:predicted Zn-dependent protease with MMP-like domain